MDSDPNQTKMPLSLFALVAAGSFFMIAGFVLMHIANPPSSAPRLSEVLMMMGALLELVFAVLCWRWLKSTRSR